MTGSFIKKINYRGIALCETSSPLRGLRALRGKPLPLCLYASVANLPINS